MNDPQRIVAPTCDVCVHALLEDQGYSNYTVEGTDFTCKLGLNPNGTFDRWYGEDKRLAFAAECPSSEIGEVESHCVDCPYECDCKGTPFEKKS